jgi:hypothetical protein
VKRIFVNGPQQEKLFLGIALLSMCIQLMQDEIMNKVSDLTKKLGADAKNRFGYSVELMGIY